MAIGILNITNTSMTDINYLVNSSNLAEFYIKVNHVIFQGWFWFIMMWVLFIILFVAANKVKDQVLNNIMYSFAAVSVLTLLLRGVNMLIEGVVQGLVTDSQMWVFPILTILCAGVVWATKE